MVTANTDGNAYDGMIVENQPIEVNYKVYEYEKRIKNASRRVFYLKIEGHTITHPNYENLYFKNKNIKIQPTTEDERYIMINGTRTRPTYFIDKKHLKSKSDLFSTAPAFTYVPDDKVTLEKVIGNVEQAKMLNPRFKVIETLYNRHGTYITLERNNKFKSLWFCPDQRNPIEIKKSFRSEFKIYQHTTITSTDRKVSVFLDMKSGLTYLNGELATIFNRINT